MADVDDREPARKRSADARAALRADLVALRRELDALLTDLDRGREVEEVRSVLVTAVVARTTLIRR